MDKLYFAIFVCSLFVKNALLYRTNTSTKKDA